MATNEEAENFAKMVGVLVGFNANWAKPAPVLALSVGHLKMHRDGKPNRVALHDVGTASAQLTMEANSRGLFVHQMAGIHAEKARETFGIPPDWQPVAAMALGYPGNPRPLPQTLPDLALPPRS